MPIIHPFQKRYFTRLILLAGMLTSTFKKSRRDRRDIQSTLGQAMNLELKNVANDIGLSSTYSKILEKFEEHNGLS